MTNVANPVYRTSPMLWILIGVGLSLAIFASFDSLKEMVRVWEISEEYGYGFMVPVISLFLIWQRKDKLEHLPFMGSWFGVAILMVGVLVVLVGQLSTLHSITQYGFVITTIGAAYAVLGWPAFSVIVTPLLLLFLMVPLPGFVLNNLSSQLQFISSELGVMVIRLFGVSVNLEGNVIDLGVYKLQVVEACSGLRYLFPLLALSIIASYFYQAAIWKRLVVILSSIPITVLMNSFRIGVIGVLVEYYGIGQAEGFLHDFEGWIVFMACVFLLLLEMWLLSRLGKDNRPFREIFGMEFPAPTPINIEAAARSITNQAFVVLLLLAIGVAGAVTIGGREEIIPLRTGFENFPLALNEWRGHSDVIEDAILNELKLDDYVLTDYRDSGGRPVNFYVAYYGSQRSGAAVHSPASCLPGGGWRMHDLASYEMLPGMVVNRTVIQKGEHRQLVYYWFKQRDRIVTNEFMVKWYLLWDALTRNRTDGALVRLTTPVAPGEDIKKADERLTAFASLVVPGLGSYIPD